MARGFDVDNLTRMKYNGQAMKKLYLGVSQGIPELPEIRGMEDGVVVERLQNGLAPDADAGCLSAYFLDHDYVKAHAKMLSRDSVLPGSILVWNPEGKYRHFDISEELIYQEIYGLNQPDYLTRVLKNLYRNLYLVHELREKEEQLKRTQKLNNELLNIGIALSAERNNDKLLDMIVYKTREITKADAGSLYLVEENEETGEKTLLFKIAHNDSNPTDFSEFRMPLNTKSIAGYVAVNGEPVNLVDAYKIPKGTDYSFNKSYDKQTGYRTKSVLAVPMKDHKERILGVIQLLNRKREFSLRLTDEKTVDEVVESFDEANESVVLSLASQAAVSLDNNRLYNEIETLFEGFVHASVKAIESRDPTTSGHSNRVALYTVGLAKAVDHLPNGRYAGIEFSADQLKEIRYASLLHDFGKVGVREHVLVKAKKLYPYQLREIELRFGYIQKTIESKYTQLRFEFLKQHGQKVFEREAKRFDEEEKAEIEKVWSYLSSVTEVNEPKVLAEEPAKIIGAIAENVYVDMYGKEQPFLTAPERIFLSIPRGSLNDDERREIESHVVHTYEFLKKIPWTGTMKNVPTIARWHHEKLDGAGYPDGKTSQELPIQSKMMTVSDIFDALTAQDRPYKPAVPRERALDILLDEAKNGHVDLDLVQLFIDAKVFKQEDK